MIQVFQRAIPFLSPPSRAAWIEISLQVLSVCTIASPPSRAAWIEIWFVSLNRLKCGGRRLHGRRGLKYHKGGLGFSFLSSPPSRAAWIEIELNSISNTKMSPPSRAAWIEISYANARPKNLACRRLHGRRGLKYRAALVGS